MTSHQTTATPSFRLKGGLYPLTQLDINHYDSETFLLDLQAKVAEAPAFFRQTPVVLGFDAFEGDLDTLPLNELKQSCLDYGLLPIAVRCNSKALAARALAAGMPALAGGIKKSPEQSPAADADEPAVESGNAESAATRLVTQPVRSGQQVYAPGGDLIVVAPVSAGAEILADGNIHVYGPLRGRALAGVKGNREARIFCHSLEAELVSIAGDFKLDEDLRGELWKQNVQICLNDQALEISAL